MTSGSERERPGDHHPLALPAGQLVRVAQEEPLGRAQAGARQGAGDQLLLGRSPLGEPVDPQPLGHRLVDGVPGVQRAGRVLQDQLHPPPVGLAAPGRE